METWMACRSICYIDDWMDSSLLQAWMNSSCYRSESMACFFCCCCGSNWMCSNWYCCFCCYRSYDLDDVVLLWYLLVPTGCVGCLAIEWMLQPACRTTWMMSYCFSCWYLASCCRSIVLLLESSELLLLLLVDSCCYCCCCCYCCYRSNCCCCTWIPGLLLVTPYKMREANTFSLLWKCFKIDSL